MPATGSNNLNTSSQFFKSYTPTLPSTVYYKDLKYMYSDPTRKCDLFNEFFNSSFSKSCFVPPSADTLPSTPDPPLITGFTEEEVYSILSIPDNSTSQGLQGITPNVLISCAAALAPTLT